MNRLWKLKEFISSILTSCLLIVLTSITVFANPVLTDVDIGGISDQVVYFTPNDVASNFENDTGLLQKVKVVTLPDKKTGKLMLNDLSVQKGQIIGIDQIYDLKFVPNAGYEGSVSFQWNGTDSKEYAAKPASVSINIAQNQAPVASDQSFTVAPGGTYTGTLQATDLDSSALTYRITVQPTNGTVNLTDAVTGAFTYQAGSTGTSDSFKFVASDGTLDSNEATVSITIGTAASPPAETTLPNETPVATTAPTTTDTPAPATPAPTTAPAPSPTIEPIYWDMNNHWAEYSAVQLYKSNIIVGEKIGDKQYFYPDKPINRLEFTLFLCAAFGKSVDPVDETPVFEDEADLPLWVKKAGKSAHEAKILSGVQANGKLYFYPYNPISRVEAVALLDKTIDPDVAAINEPLNFIDNSDIPGWARVYIKNMIGYGLLHGYDDNSLKPFKQVTRAEAAEMIWQLKKYIEAHPKS